MTAISVALLGAETDRLATLASALGQALQDAGTLAQLATAPEPSQHSGLYLLLALSAEASHAERAKQAEIRRDLAQLPSGYQVLHGQHAEALQQALTSVSAHAGRPRDASLTRRQPWVWSCEKCSDSSCEHRLLSDLLAQREARSSSA